MTTQLAPITATWRRVLSLKWSLRNSYNSLYDALDEATAIGKDKTYRYSAEDLKHIKNLLGEISLLLPEVKEKI